MAGSMTTATMSGGQKDLDDGYRVNELLSYIDEDIDDTSAVPSAPWCASWSSMCVAYANATTGYIPTRILLPRHLGAQA